MYTYKDIYKILPDQILKNISIIGKDSILFDKVENIRFATSNSICWIKEDIANIISLISNVKSCCIVLHKKYITYLEKENFENSFILCDDPKYIFSLIVNLLFIKNLKASIHPMALIHPNCRIGENVYIGPFVEIGDCIIGNGTIIHSHSKIHDNTVVGSNVIINSCVVIGGDGFGYSSNTEKNAIKFPHLGGVIIEDNVEIGSNTCIDKGSLGNTKIKQNVKIDNLVHIAHNVVIGENTFVIAHSIIGGSTIIGRNCWIAPNASILNGLNIGDNVTVGMGAVVTKDIPNNEIWAGNPAKSTQEIKEYNLKIKKLINDV